MMGLGKAGLIQSNLQAGVGYWVGSRGSRGGGCPSLQGRVLLTTSDLRLGASELPFCLEPSPRDLPGPKCTGRGIETRPTQRCVCTCVCTCVRRSGYSVPLSVSRARDSKDLPSRPRECAHPVTQRGREASVELAFPRARTHMLPSLQGLTRCSHAPA